MIVLRDMIESDIEDYVRWFTTETEWSDWDAPWEPVGSNPEEERKSWTAYCGSVKDLPPETPRQKFEIELDGRHVGWVSRYYDLDYVENPEKIPAVGIDIPEPDARGKGAGTEALRQFIDYLKAHGARRVFTQTWSGNVRMLRVAQKLGFVPYACAKDLRTVRGRKYDALTLKLDLLPEDRMETERLILADNRISDLTPLASMPDLVYVELFYNHISDLSPLSGLTKLKDLNVCSNHISDLTPLYGLTSLERLWYSDNRFTVGDHNALCEKLPGCVCNRTVWDATADGWREHERYFWMRSFFRNSPRYK